MKLTNGSLKGFVATSVTNSTRYIKKCVPIKEVEPKNGIELKICVSWLSGNESMAVGRIFHHRGFETGGTFRLTQSRRKLKLVSCFRIQASRLCHAKASGDERGRPMIVEWNIKNRREWQKWQLWMMWAREKPNIDVSGAQWEWM